jgi:hypothetical protein
MDRYLIETPHSEKNCILVLREVHAMGYLHNFEWGCKDGVHCGWAVIEAESEGQARMAVPGITRDSARVIKLIRFSEEQARELHT